MRGRSGNWGRFKVCGVAYAKSNSPTGPFQRAGKILQTDPNIANGPGHFSVVQILGMDDYIVYQCHPLGTTGANERLLAIDLMRFDASGDIEPQKMTKEGAWSPLSAKRIEEAVRGKRVAM